MKTRKALHAEKLTLEQALQTLQSKANDTTTSYLPDGTVSVVMPITATDLKQMASLRARIEQTDKRLGKRRASTREATVPATNHPVDLLTEQMLSQRWHCSASRLQRWRSANTGPAYLKIGGKVLYRLEDIYAFEAASIVSTHART